MKVVFVAVGKLRDAGARSLMDDYVARIRRYVSCEEIELKDDSALGRAISPDAFVVACEVEGKAMTSESFARQLERWGSRGKGIVQFVVGGAEGIPRSVSASSNATLSLSTMTLPHRLARVLLAEQVYRAFTILRGEPYSSK